MSLKVDNLARGETYFDHLLSAREALFVNVSVIGMLC